MPEPDDLHRLAPQVDTERATVAFRRRRRQARSYRRGAWAAGAMALVVGASAVVTSNIDSEDTLTSTGPTTPGEDGGPVTFEVLSVSEGGEPMGTLRAATSDDTLASVWSGASAEGAAPAVDFEEQVVVSITIPDDACPPDLTEFARDGDVITPVFVETATACEEPLIPKTFVVALDRAPLEPAFTLRLPADDLYDIEEQRLDVALTPVVWAHEPTPSQEGMGALIQGGLTYDEEHGCFQIGADNLRFPVVWPAGTVGVADGPGVLLPDGTVARVGDAISGGGGYLPPDDHFGIPPACVPIGEVATFNPNEVVVVNPSPAGEYVEPTCQEIELFAARISNPGFDYDYQPSASPEALFEASGLVMSGNLTGGFEVRDGSGDGDLDYVGYEVQPTRVYKGGDDLGSESPITVWVLVSLSGDDAAAFRKTIAAGAPVIVFADPLSSNQGWTAAIEGLATACPGEPPVGMTGTAGGWASLTSLEDLAARLELAGSG